jgi:hypothetical protein
MTVKTGMPGGIARRALPFITYNQHNRIERKNGRVWEVYFAFRFSWLGVFSTGGGLDKGFWGEPGMVQKGAEGQGWGKSRS